MKLLVLDDNQLIRYDVTYDETAMNNFLRKIIEDYGETCNKQLKLTGESKVSSYCDEYRDLEIVKECMDNSKIHRGRKRVERKIQTPKKLYSFTAITYPEIYYTIINFLKNDMMDFSAFLPFVNVPSNVTAKDIKFYSKRDCFADDFNAFSKKLPNEKSQYAYFSYIDKIVKTRKLQGECLKEFYDLFTFNITAHETINSSANLIMFGELFSRLDTAYMGINAGYFNDIDFYNQHLQALKEMRLARQNSNIIEKIKNVTTTRKRLYSN